MFVGFHGHSAGLWIEKASIPNQRQIQFCGLDFIFLFFNLGIDLENYFDLRFSPSEMIVFFFFFF